ncbi:MAG TPA: ABC transporter permease [Anaerolineae bacterium]|nr:ABC transporter permease [Anaerolineae bacterium]
MKIFAVFLNENKRLLREKGLILILMLMPLAFIVPIGSAYTSGAAATGDEDRPLLVIDYDGGKQAQDLIETLDESFRIERNLPVEDAKKVQLDSDPDCAAPGPACDEKIARAQLKASTRTLALLIPKGLSEAYAQSKQTIVTLLYDPAGDVNLRDQVQGVIQGAAISISLEKQVMQGQRDMQDLTSIASDDVRNAVADAAEKSSTKDLKSAIAFEQIAPSSYIERKPPNPLQQNIPGYTVMFVFLVAGFMAGWSTEEKRNGILRRLRSSPVSTASLLAGKLLYGLAVSLVQIFVLFLATSTMFRLDLGKDPVAFVLVCVALAATVACLGLLASAVKFPMSAITAPLVIGALLGGCLFSPDFFPPLLRTISYFIPHTWAMTAYQDLLVRGQGLAQVLPEIGVLLLFAAIFFGLGVWRFDPMD